MHGTNPARRPPAVAAALLVLAALLLGGCRLIDNAGDDWHDESHPAGAEPPAAAAAEPGFQVELPSWPVLVDNRLRVVARQSSPGKRVDELVAQPATAPADAAPQWSYRRSGPAVNALALLRPEQGNPVLASLWTDARMVGLDPLTGEPVWRSEAATIGKEPLSFPFNPATVGAEQVFRAVPAPGGDVLVVHAYQGLIGVAATTGEQLWHLEHAGCRTAHDADRMRWWPIGGSVVVDATCLDGGPVALRVFDPRDGTETDGYEASWGGGPLSGLRAFGCELDPAGCTVLEHYPAQAAARDPDRWSVRDGRLTPVDAGSEAEPAIEVHGNGDGAQLTGYDAHTGERAWRLVGETHDLARPQFFDVATAGTAAWVASRSWNGGPAALVQLDATDGTVVGCQPPPAGEPTGIGASPDGWLVVADLPTDRTYAYDPDAPDGTVVLLMPDPRDAIASRHGLPDCPD